MTDESEALEVDFIPAFEDARLRLDCYRAVLDTYAGTAYQTDEILKGAKVLYAWCMEIDDAAQTDDEQAEEATACAPRSH